MLADSLSGHRRPSPFLNRAVPSDPVAPRVPYSLSLCGRRHLPYEDVYAYLYACPTLLYAAGFISSPFWVQP
ncbi:unnamed protein product [Prunus armeniaca]|uniref:Uncharacterized protein n=1 Tax=Prunus armeniaca TaxID=36596 RepID=A0A6J5XJB0_PRUAR|nr:unnamed protein product [Prunus armeniaca]